MVLALTVCGIVVALVVLGLFVFGLRRRLIQRSGGTFDCSLRWDVPEKTDPGGKGWSYGVARYNGDRIEWRNAGDLRVGVLHVAMQALAAEDDDEAVFFYRFDEDLDTWDLHVAKADRDGRAFFGRNAASTAIGNVALGVDRAEVGADGDVAFLDFEADAGGFECAAADHVLERVVAEEAEVAGTAAGADAG